MPAGEQGAQMHICLRGELQELAFGCFQDEDVSRPADPFGCQEKFLYYGLQNNLLF